MKRITRPKWLNSQNLIVACALLAVTVTLGALFFVQQGRINSQQDRIDKQTSQIKELSGQNQYVTEQYVKAYGQAKASGVEPTTAPPSTLPSADTAGTTGASGKDGRGVAFSLCTALGWAVTYTDGETDTAAGDCTGERGPAGAPGKAGPAGAAGSDSTIPGPTGATGSAGAPGQDSTVPGPAGPTGATGATGDTGPAGKDGAPGKDGADGKDGRGIASVSCVDGPAFRFTYTDGTTTDIPGACDAPTPSTDPTPAG